MSDFKIAYDAFVESDKFKRWSDPETIRAPKDQRFYLEDRLKRAFEAGWRAAHVYALLDEALRDD